LADTATALGAWVEVHLGERDDEEEDELAEAIAEARARLSNQLSEAESAAADLERAQGAFGQLVDAMNPSFIALSQVGGTNDTVSDDQMLDATLGHPFLEEMGRPLIVWRNQLFAYAQMGEKYNGVRLAVACATVLYESQVMASAVGILVYEVPPTLGSDGFAWYDSFEAPAGTLAVGQETLRLAQRAREQMPVAITSFSDLVERL
jgi:hypothetical protein